jgi:hypothetical protein
MATTYATITELKARIAKSADGTEVDAMLQQILDSAAQIVDHVTRGYRRGYEAFSASASEARHYDDAPDGTLRIDDAVTVTAVTRQSAAQVEGNTRDYVLYPYNTTPKQEIRFMYGRGGGYDPARSPMAVRAVSVTGTWGYCTEATRPAIVKEATLTQAEKIYERIAIAPAELLVAMRDPYRYVDAFVVAMLTPLRRGLVVA